MQLVPQILIFILHNQSACSLKSAFLRWLLGTALDRMLEHFDLAEVVADLFYLLVGVGPGVQICKAVLLPESLLLLLVLLGVVEG